MPNKITIWTLNKAANLLDTHQQDIIKLCKTYGYDAEFGNRENTGEEDLTINLIPDIEYFVPIAPKCIGDLFTHEPPPISKILNYISKYYKKAKQDSYEKFWDFNGRNYKMITPKYKGYYSLLRETKPNVLIGYSHGAIVSRYLLWLAHNVFREADVVKGIITISSPNYGSPLVNPANIEGILDGILHIIAILLGYKQDAGKIAGNLKPHLSLDDILGGLKKLTSRLDNAKQNKSLNREKQEKLNNFIDFLIELFNWLGGLRNDPNDMLYDMNILRMNVIAPGYSILSSIHQSTPDNSIRGIINTDNSLVDLLKEVFQLFLEMVIDIIKDCIKRNKELGDIFKENAFLTEPEKHSCSEIIAIIKEIEDIINNQIMTEHPDQKIVNPVIQDRINDYAYGISPLKIKAKAHDFMLPSAYQLTVKDGKINSTYNLVNCKANHLSGGNLTFKAGKKNYEYVKRLLKEMLKQGT